jgi:hypothetical protein
MNRFPRGGLSAYQFSYMDKKTIVAIYSTVSVPMVLVTLIINTNNINLLKNKQSILVEDMRESYRGHRRRT